MAGGSSAVRMGRAFVEIFADSNMLVKGLNDIKAKLTGLGNFGINIGKIFAGVGTAVTAPLAGLFTGAAERNRAIGDLATQFNTTTESISQLAGGFETAGVSFSEFGNIVSGLQSKFIENNDLLRLLQINTRAFSRATAQEQLSQVADAFTRMTDKTDRATIASELFGSSWARLLPYLEKGRDGIRQLQSEGTATIVSADQVERGTAAIKGLSDIWDTLKYALLDVGAALLPTKDEIKSVVGWIQEIGKGVREWVNENKELIRGIFIAGAALTGAGFAIAGFGTALTFAGFAAGTIATVFAGIGGAIQLAFSPLGLFVAELGTLFYLFASKTDIVSNAFATLKTGFQEIGDTVKAVWGGISNAIKGGDLTTAFKIVSIGLQLIWAQAVATLNDTWRGFIFDFGGLMLSALNGLRLLFVNWGAWISREVLFPLIQGFLDHVQGVVGIFSSSTAGKIGALKDQFSDEKVNANRDRMAKEIEQEDSRAHADAAAGRSGRSRADSDEIARLKYELNQLLKKASASALASGPGGSSDPNKVALPLAAGLSDKVRGTFSGSAIAQQLGVGDTVAQRQLDGINSIAKSATATAASTDATAKAMVALGDALRLGH